MMVSMHKYSRLRRLLLLFCLVESIGLLFPIYAQPNRDSLAEKENGFAIKVIYPGHMGAQIILGHYYDQMVMGDVETALDENSTGEFTGSSPLKGGVYTFIVNGQVVPGDFIIDKDQDFTVYLHDEQTNGSVFQNFDGSKENDKLLEYQSFMAQQGEQIQNLHQLLSISHDLDESSRYFEVLDKIDDRIRQFRTQVIIKSPGSTLGMVLSALSEPKLPAHLKNPQNKTDSLAAREFMSTHFWDGTDFWDGRLANTPFLSDKLDRYFTQVLIPQKDKVIPNLDKILENAVADSMLYRLILKKVIYGSKDHLYKWDDAVFIHLYEKYLASEPLEWLSAQDRDDIDKYAFFLMGNTTGAKAPGITLGGFHNEAVALNDLVADYTLLVFWDPTCEHCKLVLPKLDSLLSLIHI